MSVKHGTVTRKLDAKYLKKLTNPRLAIIVPIYNVEDYLFDTLTSIVTQKDFEHYEVILVDDGSSDKSPLIAQQFAEKYPNVWFYQQKNAGAGVARNFALTKVSAEYVTFVDSDDLLPENAYVWMLRQFSHPDTDISIGRMERFPIAQKFVWDKVFDHGTRIEPTITSVPELIHGAGPCNKIYRMSKIRENDFKFGIGVHFEDAHFVVPYLLSCNGIGIQNAVSYLYRKRDNNTSVMDSLFNRKENYWDYLELCDNLLGLYSRLDASKNALLDEFIIRGLQGFVFRSFDVFDDDELYRYQLRIQNIFETVSVSAIKKSTAHPGIRLAYARLLGTDATTFSAADVRKEPLSIVGTKAFVGYEAERNQNLRFLRQVGNLVIGAESLIRKQGKLVFEGRITAKHARMDTLPLARLQLRLAGKRFEGTWRKRPDRAHSAGLYSGFRFEIPLEDLPSGEFLFHIFLISEHGQYGATSHKTMALFRNSLPLSYKNTIISIFSDAKNRVLIRNVERNTKSIAARLYGDYQNYKKRLPFSAELLIRSITKPLIRKQIVIIGERWGQQNDNGIAFFERILNTVPGVKAYYLTDPEGSLSSVESVFARKVKHSSWKHKFLMLHADLIANAYDVDTYTLPKQWDKMEYLEYLRPRTRTRRMFLQHGVIYRDTAAGLHRLVQGYDYFVTSTNDESKYVTKHLDYGSRRVVESGLPRFEKLDANSDLSPKRILFAPTWRSYLVTPSYKTFGNPRIGESFKESSYYQTITEVLSSKKLEEVLVRHNCVLDFLPHPEVRGGFESITGINDRILFSSDDEIDYASSISRCSLFITDYSSILFDAAYMRKPSIYFTFDENDFNTYHSPKGYFDFERDGFGPVVQTLDALIATIEKTLSSDFEVPELYKKRIEKQFLNSRISPTEIIVSAIKK
ncbi:bifunctional glycosyltransferase/CDP-glycerol:glycerophosphate glycerophosphotransferase [Glutamicibacter sp. PAEs-4]|uniref:bifunctional glycosyltransferase/CDP-glycerol:glycerophosphate glycerophosphotransferase n=1 Tax=Glutamicibacter sp. PAEs-4 TaxID=3444114 RepID=UPI003EBFF626